jgi:CHASE1-domain containing sensor protein
MLIYEPVLRGGVALFNDSEKVSREKLKNYVVTLSIEKYWPGVQGVGFSIPVDTKNKNKHIKIIQDEGFKTYTIQPAGKRSEYSAIIFLEPFDWRNKRAWL